MRVDFYDLVAVPVDFAWKKRLNSFVALSPESRTITTRKGSNGRLRKDLIILNHRTVGQIIVCDYMGVRDSDLPLRVPLKSEDSPFELDDGDGAGEPRTIAIATDAKIVGVQANYHAPTVGSFATYLDIAFFPDDQGVRGRRRCFGFRRRIRNDFFEKLRKIRDFSSFDVSVVSNNFSDLRREDARSLLGDIQRHTKSGVVKVSVRPMESDRSEVINLLRGFMAWNDEETPQLNSGGSIEEVRAVGRGESGEVIEAVLNEHFEHVTIDGVTRSANFDEKARAISRALAGYIRGT